MPRNQADEGKAQPKEPHKQRRDKYPHQQRNLSLFLVHGALAQLTPGLSGAEPRAYECKQDAPSRARPRPLVIQKGIHSITPFLLQSQ